MEASPGAFPELRDAGPSLAPAVVVDDRIVRGWNPQGWAALLGVDYEPAVALPAAELGMMLDRVLAATERLITGVPDGQMAYRAPECDRTIRDLAYHVFSVALAFADGMDVGQVRVEWLRARAPAELRDGPGIARYGALVRGRVGGWLEGAGPREFSRMIAGEAGPQSGHDWLVRTAWHAAQHLRQLQALAEALGLPVTEPLPAVELARLALPVSLW